MNQLSGVKQQVEKVWVVVKTNVRKLAVIGLVLVSFIPSLIHHPTPPQNPNTIHGFQDQSSTLIEKL